MAASPSLNPGSVESDLSRVRHKLRKFLQRRPTLQSLRDKGYIKGTCAGIRAQVARGWAALTNLSPRPGVWMCAGSTVRAREESCATLRAAMHPHRRGPGYVCMRRQGSAAMTSFQGAKGEDPLIEHWVKKKEPERL